MVCVKVYVLVRLLPQRRPGTTSLSFFKMLSRILNSQGEKTDSFNVLDSVAPVPIVLFIVSE